MTQIERPEDTYSPSYKIARENILRWRNKNKEHLRQYNREYQRNLRKDPVKYQELRMRICVSQYLRGQWKTSYKITSAMGMDRAQLAAKNNMTEQDLIKLLKTHEIDHIVSANWFNAPENKHLKPYMYRHYNIQFVEKATNRTKHKYVDENDYRIQLVIVQLKLDYYNSKNELDKETMNIVDDLSIMAKKLRTKIMSKYRQ